MKGQFQICAALLMLVTALSACAIPARPDPSSVDGQPAARPAAPKRIVAATQSDPPTISAHYIAAGSGTIPGGDAIEELVNAGLTLLSNRGQLEPQLAERAPTLENGDWKLLPDGRMETTWQIRETARWHDGTPFTVEDILFTSRLSQDRELAFFRDPSFDLVESVEAPDARTVLVRWKQPFIRADATFTRAASMPRPRHILERPYEEYKESVTQHPYWTDEYVGTGAYRVRQFVRSSHLVLAANDQYVLGRPKIDEIEVRFIPNGNALVANLLAGEVQLTLGRNLSLKQAVQMRDQWREGQMVVGFKNWIALYPQLLNPNPAILSNVEFRRGLLHGLDRQQLVETLQEGLVPVAHSFLSPSDPMHREIEPRIVRYEHDPRRAAQLIEGLGYTKGGDGMYRDGAGRLLTLEVRTSAEDDTHEAGVFTVADFWRRIGLGAEPFLIPQAQRNDREFNSTYPGIRFWRLPNEPDDLRRYSSKDAPLPENRFAGGNRSRYMNPEYDALIERYMTTIPHVERTSILGDIVHHMTDQLTIMGLWYNTEPVMIGNRLVNVTVRDVGQTTEAWNAHLWDTK
jgi:peptide/nickel transport system substrate-binding protein